jgi:hypothetical protein
MNLKAALLATATAGAFLLVAACGGDGGPSQPANATDSTQSQPGSSSGSPAQYVAIDLDGSGGYGSTFGSGISDGEQAGSGEFGRRHALLWRGSASSVVDLHPGGFWDGSGINATSGGMQVGWGQADDHDHHALKWAGSASSVVDLHPAGFRYSEALGISGDQVVGFGEVPNTHALLWTSRGVVDLHPSGFTWSVARATDGAQQVGGGDGHALLWMGSANSVVDLHPAGYTGSHARGVSGGQQVGEGGVGSLRHALLWTGSAQSVVDLHPSGFRETGATAVAAGRQVGWGITADGSTHALLWNGTADSVVDLHAFLPPGFSNSQAAGIDASGNVIGNARVIGIYFGHAILWVRQ